MSAWKGRTNIFTTQTFYVWTHTDDPSTMCGVEPETFTQDEYPSNLVTQYEYDPSITQSYTVLPLAHSTSPITVPTAISYCTFVGVTKSKDMGTSVYPNVLFQGDNITIHHTGVGAVELYAVDGSKAGIVQVLKAGDNTLSTNALSAGMYLLRICDRSGIPVHTERIVVE